MTYDCKTTFTMSLYKTELIDDEIVLDRVTREELTKELQKFANKESINVSFFEVVYDSIESHANSHHTYIIYYAMHCEPYQININIEKIHKFLYAFGCQLLALRVVQRLTDYGYKFDTIPETIYYIVDNVNTRYHFVDINGHDNYIDDIFFNTKNKRN